MLVRLFRLRVISIFDDRWTSVEQLRKENRNLTLMVQADMIAYHEPGEPPQLGLPPMYVSSLCAQLRCLALNFTNNSIGTPEVTQLVANISGLYSPELLVGNTPVCPLLAVVPESS
jgi:hypothetical protein